MYAAIESLTTICSECSVRLGTSNPLSNLKAHIQQTVQLLSPLTGPIPFLLMTSSELDHNLLTLLTYARRSIYPRACVIKLSLN